MNFDYHFVSGGNWGGFVYLIYILFLRFVIVHREFQDGEDCVTDVCRFGVKKKKKKNKSRLVSSVLYFSAILSSSIHNPYIKKKWPQTSPSTPVSKAPLLSTLDRVTIPIPLTRRCPHIGAVTQDERDTLLGQKGCTVWLTGLSASGKASCVYV